MNRRALAALGLALLCSLPTRALAGGSTTSIYGARRNGMLTVMGKPDDLTALFHNPAGLADLKGIRAFLFVSPAFLSSSFRMQALDEKRFPDINPAGCGQGAAAACPWPIDSEGYYARDIRPEEYFGVIPYLSGGTDLGFLGREDITVAAAIYSPNFYGAFLPEGAPTAYGIIGGYFVVISAAVGAGWRINDYISVGANVSYNYMRLTIAQRISLANALTPAGQDPAGLASLAQTLIGDLRMDYDGTEHGLGWTAGVLVTPLPWLSIGLTYAGNTSPSFQGEVSFSAYNARFSDAQVFNDVVHSVGYKLPTEMVIEQAIPHALFGGVNVALGSQVELAVDVRFWFYNAFSMQTIRPIYDPTEKGTEPLTEASLSKDKQYKLSWQVTGGVMVRPLRSYPGLELMTGAGYDQSPIPDQTLTLDNPNMSHIKFTAGVRWRVNDHWSLAATYLLNVYTSRDVRDSQTNPPTNVQITSHSHSPALSVGYRF
jgi:long-subunit fatty acid transport protein